MATADAHANLQDARRHLRQATLDEIAGLLADRTGRRPTHLTIAVGSDFSDDEPNDHRLAAVTFEPLGCETVPVTELGDGIDDLVGDIDGMLARLAGEVGRLADPGEDGVYTVTPAGADCARQPAPDEADLRARHRAERRDERPPLTGSRRRKAARALARFDVPLTRAYNIIDGTEPTDLLPNAAWAVLQSFRRGSATGQAVELLLEDAGHTVGRKGPYLTFYGAAGDVTVGPYDWSQARIGGRRVPTGLGARPTNPVTVADRLAALAAGPDAGRDLSGRRFLVTIDDEIGHTDDVLSWADLPADVQTVLAATGLDDVAATYGDGHTYRARLLPDGFDSWAPTVARAVLAGQ